MKPKSKIDLQLGDLVVVSEKGGANAGRSGNIMDFQDEGWFLVALHGGEDKVDLLDFPGDQLSLLCREAATLPPEEEAPYEDFFVDEIGDDWVASFEGETSSDDVLGYWGGAL